MQEDTYTGDVQDPLSLNIYTYCYNNPLIYEDPSGHFVLTSILVAALIGTAIGATIGAGMDIGSQMLFEDKSFKELDWKSVGVSALEGGISGLIGGLTGGTSVAVTTGQQL